MFINNLIPVLEYAFLHSTHTYTFKNVIRDIMASVTYIYDVRGLSKIILSGFTMFSLS